MTEPNFQEPDDHFTEITVEDKKTFPQDEIPREIPQDEESYRRPIPPDAPVPQDESIQQKEPSHRSFPKDESINDINPVLLGPVFENTHLAKRLFEKYESSIIIVTKINEYGNSVILGSFCYAITFIVYGFYRAKVYTVNETFLWSMILFFGSIGQCTAGFLELIRAVHFTALLYLTTGFYCLSHFTFYIYPKLFGEESEVTFIYYSGTVCTFYSAMVVVSFLIAIASAQTNLLLILQCGTCFVFFLLRAIGEGHESLHLKRNGAGILQAISGFFSLLVFMSQVVNNVMFKSAVFPVCPIIPENGIDVPPSR